MFGQMVDTSPHIAMGTHEFEEVLRTWLPPFTSNLSLDTELNKRIGKAAAVMAKLAKRVWEIKKRMRKSTRHANFG